MINYFYLAKFFLFLLPLNVALVTKSTLFPFIVGKYVWFRTSLDIALILFILGLIFRRKESELFVQRFLRILKMPLFLAVTAFITTFLLAGFFGFDPSQSFWSNFERGEGGLQIIHLYIFFILLLVLLETPKDWHRMLIMISIGAFLMMLYGYAALFNFDWAVGSSLEKQSIAEGNRFTGSIGNAAYVGGYLIFVAFYVFYMLVNFYQTNKKARFILYIFLAMIALTFWLASTRGSLIGLVSAVLGGLLYIGYTHRLWRKWIISTIIVFLIFGSALVKFRETSFVKSIPGSHIFDLSFNTETFRHRILMWQIAIAGWKERPIFGWGPENFYAVFDRHFDTRYFEPQKGFGAWFDRAHSVFFDYLAETGLLGLLGYFGIFATYYIEFIRYGGHALKQHSAGDQKEKKYKQTLITNAFLFGIPIAYLAQGLVLFDILTIYWNIFFVLAFAAYIFEQKKHQWSLLIYAINMKIIRTIFFTAIIILALGSIYFGSYLPLRKSQKYIIALQRTSQIRNVQEFKNNFNPPLNFYSPVGQEEIVKFLTNDMASIIGRRGQQEEAVRALINYIEPYAIKNNVRHLLAIGRMYESLWLEHKKDNDFEKAEMYYLQALLIGPKLPPVLLSLLNLYKASGDQEKFEAITQKLVTYWPIIATLDGQSTTTAH